jgi:hypothetical protein
MVQVDLSIVPVRVDLSSSNGFLNIFLKGSNCIVHAVMKLVGCMPGIEVQY